MSGACAIRFYRGVRSEVWGGGGKGLVERRNVEIGREKLSEIVGELHFFPLFAHIRDRDVDGVLFGLAQFGGLSALLQS